MKFKNHTPSHKVKNNNSKSLLSSTIEYIKNDLKNDSNNNIEKITKNSKTYLYENGKNNQKSNSNNTEINTAQEQINRKQSKS